jgi:4-aminobutyrate aminotransferase
MVARSHIVTWPRGSHGNTYGGNPLACAAAIATLNLIENEYLKNAAEVGQYTLDALAEMQMRHPSMGDVRGIGLMIGVEFVKSRPTHEPFEKLRDRIIEMAFERGLLTLGCGKSAIRLAPPLCVSSGEIDEGLNILDEAITLAERSFS